MQRLESKLVWTGVVHIYISKVRINSDVPVLESMEYLCDKCENSMK